MSTNSKRQSWYNQIANKFHAKPSLGVQEQDRAQFSISNRKSQQEHKRKPLTADDIEARSAPAYILNTATLFDNPEFSDIKLQGCDAGRAFYCHRLILSSASPVFKNALAGHMGESLQSRDVQSEMLAHILRYVYTKRYPDVSRFPTTLQSWCYHWLIEEAAASCGLAELARDANYKCSDGLSLISSARDAYDAIIWLHGKRDMFRCAVLKEQFRETMLNDHSVQRDMQKNQFFNSPALRHRSGMDDLKEMSLIYCNHCNTQAIYEPGSTRRMPCSHPGCEYQVNEDEIPCWIKRQDIAEFSPSVRAKDRNAERNQRAPLMYPGYGEYHWRR